MNRRKCQVLAVQRASSRRHWPPSKSF